MALEDSFFSSGFIPAGTNPKGLVELGFFSGFFEFSVFYRKNASFDGEGGEEEETGPCDTPRCVCRALSSNLGWLEPPLPAGGAGKTKSLMVVV